MSALKPPGFQRALLFFQGPDFPAVGYWGMRFPDHLYVHIPFCRSRCRYCSFSAVVVSRVPEKEYRAALEREFEWRRVAWELDGRPRLETVYFGGGTPSLLSPSFYAGFLEWLAAKVELPAGAEITLEANPADLDRRKAAALRAAGINRISLGAQTFSEVGLRLLGRRHRAEEIARAVGFVRAAGIADLSLDLICAWPGESMAILERDLERLVGLRPEHISVYLLSLEAGTVLERMVREGRVGMVADEKQVEMMQLVTARLEEAGFLRYEVSSFSRADAFQSRHNLGYWRLSDYLGLGAGACGSRRCRRGEGYWAERYRNHDDPQSYLDEIADSPAGSETLAGGEGGSLPWEDLEIIDRDASFREALMLGLRLRHGVCLAELENEYGRERVSAVVGRTGPLLRAGLVGLENGCLWITAKGLPLGDEITVALF